MPDEIKLTPDENPPDHEAEYTTWAGRVADEYIRDWKELQHQHGILPNDAFMFMQFASMMIQTDAPIFIDEDEDFE